MATNNQTPLLEVRNLKTYFYTEDGVVHAVDGVDFYVNSGEVLGIVGESGCGKSVTSLSIMRLISVPGKIEAGEILFEGKDLVKATEEEMMKIRGNRVSMIFQQPQSALNPVFRGPLFKTAKLLGIQSTLAGLTSRVHQIVRFWKTPD